MSIYVYKDLKISDGFELAIDGNGDFRIGDEAEVSETAIRLLGYASPAELLYFPSRSMDLRSKLGKRITEDYLESLKNHVITKLLVYFSREDISVYVTTDPFVEFPVVVVYIEITGTFPNSTVSKVKVSFLMDVEHEYITQKSYTIS